MTSKRYICMLAVSLATLCSTVLSGPIATPVSRPPIVDQLGATRVLELNDTGSAYTLPLFFGTPAQYNNGTSTFVPATGFQDIIVTAYGCEDCLHPFYNMTQSSTDVNRTNATVTTPAAQFGQFTGLLTTDQVCILFDKPCATQVQFYTMLENWGYWNVLGLAPKNSREGPNLIRMLQQQGGIDSQVATLNFNPHESGVTSTLVLGTPPSGIIEGDWYTHKLRQNTESYFSDVILGLNVTNITYGDEVVLFNQSFEALLSSTERQLFHIGSDSVDLWFKWAEVMNQTQGVQCTVENSVGNRFGQCTLSLAAPDSACSAFYPQMKSITIRVDDILYTLPPEAQAFEYWTNPGVCVFAVVLQEAAKQTLIGLPFFKQFVTSYDYVNGTINFGMNGAGYSGSSIEAVPTPAPPTPTPTPPTPPLPPPTPTPVPVPDDPTQHSHEPDWVIWLVIGLIALAVIFCGILIITLIFCCLRRKTDQEARGIAYEQLNDRGPEEAKALQGPST